MKKYIFIFMVLTLFPTLSFADVLNPSLISPSPIPWKFPGTNTGGTNLSWFNLKDLSDYNLFIFKLKPNNEFYYKGAPIGYTGSSYAYLYTTTKNIAVNDGSFVSYSLYDGTYKFDNNISFGKTVLFVVNSEPDDIYKINISANPVSYGTWSSFVKSDFTLDNTDGVLSPTTILNANNLPSLGFGNGGNVPVPPPITGNLSELGSSVVSSINLIALSAVSIISFMILIEILKRILTKFSRA